MLIRKWALLLLPVLAAGCAQSPLYYSQLNQSENPGSVIVFPKFKTGTVSVDGKNTPRTEFALGVVCPAGSTCTQHQPVKIRLQWVCPGLPDQSFICPTVDIDIAVSVNGKAVFNTEYDSTFPGPFGPNRVPRPPCPDGYLIGWVVDRELDRPVKFDGLIGDAVIRSSTTAVAFYAAIPIQADAALVNYNGSNFNAAAIATGQDPVSGRATLPFDGGAGHYRGVAGAVLADVTFNNRNRAAATDTSLILLTLDARSSFPNNWTTVPLNFYNETEMLRSASSKFLCWTETSLTTIDKDLTQQLMGTPKGLLVSGQAVSQAVAGVPGTPGPVTLLGLVETRESSAPIGKAEKRTLISNMSGYGQPVPTSFAVQTSFP